jgi:hypothetical protein
VILQEPQATQDVVQRLREAENHFNAREPFRMRYRLRRRDGQYR